MKTKTLSLISTICLAILFLSSMYFGYIGMVYMITDGEERINLLRIASSNWTIPITCFVDMVAISILFSMCMYLTRHGKTIEDIDKKQKILDESIRKYDTAALKLVKKVLETDFVTIPQQIKSNKI